MRSALSPLTRRDALKLLSYRSEFDLVLEVTLNNDHVPLFIIDILHRIIMPMCGSYSTEDVLVIVD